MIVCGTAARWWGSEIKEKYYLFDARIIVINGREDLWDEYCRLHEGVQELVREKK